MQSIFRAIQEALLGGQRAVLVSIVAASGSVPRGAGAKMAVFAEATTGTIGGGAVEGRSIDIARDVLHGRPTAVTSFSLNAGGVADVGMVCGGEVEICFQLLQPDDPNALAMVAAVLAILDSTEDAWLITRIQDDVAMTGLYDAAHGLRFLSGLDEAAVQPMLGLRSALARGDAGVLFVEPIVHAGTVYIFGGGHVSQALQPLLGPLSFRYVVFEDRPAFVAGGMLGDFADIGAKVTLTARDYAVIMTRGHASDIDVVAQVLGMPVRYVGLMGSRKKLAVTHQALRERGVDEAEFARIHNPIGLAIGAQTPAEIAISIAAELVLERNKDA